MITSLQQVVEKAREFPTRTVAVVVAEQESALESVRDAMQAGLVRPLLFGAAEAIREKADRVGLTLAPEQIMAAQNPIHGWDRQTRAFSPTAGIDAAPRWADFADPLEAISGRARARRPVQRTDGKQFTPEERSALEVLGLEIEADRKALRRRYSELVHALHPDRNGGDRSSEKRLQAVIEAYQLLRKAAPFA